MMFVNEVKYLNEWLAERGYTWVEGKEQMMKSPLPREDAEFIIMKLRREGAITNE